MSQQTLTIASGTAVSGEFGMQDRNIGFGVICPGDWTAADLGFEVSRDGTTWYLLRDETATLKFTGLPTTGGFARALSFPNSIVVFPKIRLKSLNSSTDAALNQTANRILYLYTVDLM